MKLNLISLQDLDPNDAIEVIPNQDIETSIRFSVPVPNFKSCITNGELESKYWFFKPYSKPTNNLKEIRLFFKNFKDDCQQGAKIDGTGAIIFMGKPHKIWIEFLNYLNKNYSDIAKISPDEISKILSFSRLNFGIIDRYNENVETILKTMSSVETLSTNLVGYGGFVYNKIISAAVFISGHGEFIDGPAYTNQKFTDGCYITFPGITKNELVKLYENDITNIKSKLVQRDVFLNTRTYEDGSSIKNL